MPAWRLIELPQRMDARGSLVFAQDGDQLPFPVKRIFVIYDVAANATRGGHAHRQQHQLLMMMHGTCTIEIDDGAHRTTVRLDRPTHALHVPPGLWLDLREFSPQAVCSTLASGCYDESDYIRDYAAFRAFTNQ